VRARHDVQRYDAGLLSGGAVWRVVRGGL
jgi:hypothetical protein